MTDLHALAEKVAREWWDSLVHESDLVTIIERALAKLQLLADRDIEAAFNRGLKAGNEQGQQQQIAIMKLQAQHEAKRIAAVAEALERAAQVGKTAVEDLDDGGEWTGLDRVAEAVYMAIRSLSPDVGDKVLVSREALRVLEAAKILTPLLDEGWDEYDTPDDQNVGVRACEELQAATKAMLAATKEKS